MAMPISRLAFQRLSCSINLFKHLNPASLLQSNRSQNRHIHRSQAHNNNPSYEADGKTTVTILNDEYGAPLMIDSYTQQGFKLNNGIKVMGPVIIFPRTVLGWDVGAPQDITPTSLTLFSVLEPKPDVLVIGVGDRGSKLPLETVKFLKSKRINLEVLATEHACTTFNFLSGEGRCVAAVMIPPTQVNWTAYDLANSKYKRRKLYDDDDAPFDPDKPGVTPNYQASEPKKGKD